MISMLGGSVLPPTNSTCSCRTRGSVVVVVEEEEEEEFLVLLAPAEKAGGCMSSLSLPPMYVESLSPSQNTFYTSFSCKAVLERNITVMPRSSVKKEMTV